MPFWNQIIISSSGGSVTLSSPTSGSVDGSTTAFGFSSKPTMIVSDGATYQENKGWTWNGVSLTATMSVPPLYDIYSIR